MSKSEKKFKIAYDVDGSLLASERAVLDAANDRLKYFGFSKTILKSDLNKYDALYYIVYEHTESEKLAKEIRNYWYDPEILKLSPPNPALIEVFNRLHHIQDISQVVITSRPVSSCGATIHSLKKYIPDIDWMLVDPQKFFIRDTNTTGMDGLFYKMDQIKEQKINYLFDDGPLDIYELKIRHPKCAYSYITQPWNKDAGDEEADSHRISLDTDSPDSIIMKVFEAKEKYFSSLPSTRRVKR